MLIRQTKKVQAIAFMSALFLVTAINAAEQGSANAEVPKAQQDRFESMAQKLQLTEKQKSDLKPMLEKLKKNRAETVKKLEEQEEKELSSILKPEQVSQVSRYLKRSQRMGGGNREGMKKGDMEKRKMGGERQQTNHPKPPAKLPEKQ